MNHPRTAFAALLVGGLIGAPALLAQDRPRSTQPPATAVPASAPTAPATTAPAPDPFATPPAIADKAREQATARSRGASPVAPQTGAVLPLPTVRLRAFLRMRGKKPAAMVEAGGDTFLVRGGERLSLPVSAAPGAPHVVVLIEVGADAVTARRADGSGQAIVLR